MKWLADRFFWHSPDEYSEAQARFRLKISPSRVKYDILRPIQAPEFSN